MDFDFTTETITPDSGTVLTVSSTGALVLPSSTTVNRPASPATGALRLNTTGYTTGPILEHWNGSSWAYQLDNTNLVAGVGMSVTPNTTSGKTVISGATYVYSTTVTPTTLVSGNIYSATVTHNLGTSNVVVSVYNNSTGQLINPNAIQQLGPNALNLQVSGNTGTYLVVVAPGSSFLVTPTTLVSGNIYSATVTHNLGTENIIACVYNNTTGQLITPNAVQQTSINALTLQVAGNTTTYNVVIAIGSSFLVTPATLVSGNIYSGIVTHNFNTNNIIVCVYNNSTQQMLIPDAIQQTSVNALTLQVVGNTNTYNVIILNGVGYSGGSSSSSTTLKTFTFYPAALESPNNSDWAVNSLAPLVADPLYPSLLVRQFSTSAEGGVGTYITVPSTATNIQISFKGRAQTAPTLSRTIVPLLYVRSIPNNAAVSAWSSAYTLTSQTVPTNAYFQYYTLATTTLATYGMVASGLYLIQFDLGTTGTYTTSNWLMSEFTVTFT
jgi:hypothetical protein